MWNVTTAQGALCLEGGCWQEKQGKVEGVWIGLARFTCTADRAAGRWERRPGERGPLRAGERGQRWTGSVTHGDPSQTGIELDTGRGGGPHDSSKSAGCNDGGDAPRAERWIPAEPDTLHHNPASECERLHQSLTVINPDFQTDAWAKQPGTRTTSRAPFIPLPCLCDETGIRSGRREQFWSEPAFYCTGFDVHAPAVMSRATDKRGTMLARCYRGKLSVWAALCVLVLCWFYIFPGYRLPGDKEIVEEVLRQGEVWQKSQTGIDLYRFVSGSDSCLLV